MNYSSLKISQIVRQKGTVLIVALFIMVLLEISVAGLILYQRLEIRSATNFLSSQKAIQNAYGGEVWARAAIAQSYSRGKNLAEMNKQIPIEGGNVSISVMDVQGRYNLNNLASTKEIPGFQNMMNTAVPSGDKVALAIIKYIQQQQAIIQRSNTAGEAVSPLTTVTQLRPIAGMNAKQFNQLLRHCFVLPIVSPLNINTATATTLMSLSPNITAEKAQAIVAMRKSQNGFKQLWDFISLEALEGTDIERDKITVLSQFYLSTVVVHTEDSDLTLYSLLRVIKAENRYVTIVYWRSYGTI